MKGVGDQFPYVTLTGVASNNNFVDVNFGPNYHWKVVYFYPKDFTFICPTEIAGFDKIAIKTDVHVIGISGDNEYCKLAWKAQNETLGNIHHTLCHDGGLQLADQLGVADFDKGVAYRATFIVDPDNIIQHVSCNALDTGRNTDEVFRNLKAIQAGGPTGNNWKDGEEFIG